MKYLDSLGEVFDFLTSLIVSISGLRISLTFFGNPQLSLLFRQIYSG